MMVSKKTIIIVLVILLLFASPYGFIYLASKVRCGQGGMLIGSGKQGYYCGYQTICKDCQNSSQCPNCTTLCESKGKIKREGFCGASQIDLTNKVKHDEEGNFYIEQGLIRCYCCCDKK
jgi:hypothetical protein